MIKKVDLRGLTCPEPVLRTKKLLDDRNVERIEALVDDDVCVNNLQRLSRSVKASATFHPKDGYFEVVIERGLEAPASEAQARAQTAPAAQSSETNSSSGKVGTVILIGKDTFGEGEPEFSRTLLNLFLQSVLAGGHELRAILLTNTGVKLLATDSPALKVLQDFKASGCEVLACGLCVDFYGLKEMIPPEQITNMFAIVEYLLAADKVLSP